MNRSTRRRHGWRLRVVAPLATLIVATTAGTALAYVPPGVDTSHYQGTKNWPSVHANGIQFAYLKATESTTFTDPTFARDWAGTAAAGIYRGAYHFGRPSTSANSAVRQADYFVSKIGSQTGRGTLPPVLDLEATGGLKPGQLITWTRLFLERLKARTGRTPVIYVSPAFWRDNLRNSTGFHAYPLWIANYRVSSPSVPGGWPTWTFWQGSSTGSVRGISGNVDTDVFNGSLAQLATLALAGGPQTTALKLSTDNAKPAPNAKVNLSGTLTDASGKPVTSSQVLVRRRYADSSTWINLARLNTDASGRFTRPTVIPAAAVFQATYAGNSSYRAATSPALTVSLAAQSSQLTVAGAPASAPAGTPLSFTGTLRSGTRALSGKVVTLARQATGSTTWTTLARATTTAQGTYRLTTSATASGTYRVSYAGEAAYRSATAQTAKVAVITNAATLTVRPSKHGVLRGRGVSVLGTLQAKGGAGVAGRSVVLLRHTFGTSGWVTVGTVRTDASGRFAVPQTMARGAQYRALYRGDPMYRAVTSPTATVTIVTRRATRLPLAVHRTSTRPRQLVTLSGSLRAAGRGVGATLGLWQRGPGQRTWRFVAPVHTRAGDGAWQARVRPSRTTTYRLVFRGGAAYFGVQRMTRVGVNR